MSFLLRFRVPVLAVFLAGTAFLFSQLTHIRPAGDPLGSMLPTGHPFLPALQAIRKMAPEPRMLIAILEVKGGDIYNPETIRKIDAITRRLTTIDGVLPGGITSLTRGITHYENTGEGLAMEPILGRTWPETAEDFEKLKRMVAVNPKGPGRYVSYDGTATMITASLVEGSDEKLLKELLSGVEAIRSSEEDRRHRLLFMGPQLIEAQMRSMGLRHIPVAAAATFLLAGAALFARFRSLGGVLLPVLVMVLSLLWAFGMVGAAGVELNPMPLLFPVILGLFSLAYGVLVLEHYERAYPCTRDKAPAIRAAYGRVPLAVSIVTSGGVFVSLFAAGIPAFEGLAWMGLFWTVGTVAVVVFALPVLLSFVRAPSGRGDGEEPGRPGKTSSLTFFSAGRGRFLAAALLAALLFLGGLSAARLEVGDNVPGASYIRADHPWNQCFRLLAEKFMGPYQLLVHARANEPGGLLDPEAVLAIGDFSRYLRKQCGARDSIAFDMMVKAARSMMMDGNPKWLTVPLSREQVQGMGELVVEQGGVEGFIDKTFTEATVSPFFPWAETERIDEVAARMQAYIDRHPSARLVFRLGGGLLGMTKAVNDGARRAYRKTLAAAFLIVLACGVLATGSLSQGLVITLPIAAAQGGVWLIMAAAGMKIDMPAATVAAATVGFCPVFAYAQIREIGMPAHEPGCSRPDGHPGFRGRLGIVPFLGLLVFSGLFPWFFIGLRFLSGMALASGMAVLLAGLSSALFLPALAALRRGRWPAGLRQEGRP
jgi:hypothetical protein